MSPLKKGSAKPGSRRNPRATARKVAGKVARNAASQRASKRAARRAGTGAAKKSARGAPKRTTKRTGRAARKSARAARLEPKLRLVKRPAAAKPATGRKARKRANAAVPVPAAFADAKAGASAKELVLFELERARVSVHAAIQGLSEAASNRPNAPGKWSPRQIVLHLARWDRDVAGWVEPVFSHNRSVPFDWSQLNAHNVARMAEMKSIGWDEARRFLHSARAELFAALESIPEEPAELWTREHPLGKMIWILPGHDRHHADQIKRARETPPPH